MRIFIFAVSFCEYIIQKANALVSKGHEVMVMMPYPLISSTVGSEINILLDQRINTIFYRGKKRPNRLFDLFRMRFFKIIGNFSPDVFHIHENAEIETLLICLRFPQVPLIITIHDVIPHIGADSRISLRGKLIKGYLRHHADTIHVHGETLKNELSKLDYRLAKKGEIIPHGTLSLFTHWDNHTVQREPYTCLFFGRMEKYRGLDNLIKIADVLKKSIPEIKIIVAGRGSELVKYREDLIQSGIFEIHDSFIPDNIIYTFFRRSSLLLLPYHEASQSGVVHMSLAFGLPLVATSVGAIPETVQDGIHGRIVPRDDMKSFAEAIICLLQDRVILQKMEIACHERGRELEFTNIVEQYEKLYAGVLDRL